MQDRFFFYFGSVLVVFLKTQIRFGMSLVRFGLINAVRFGYCSYLLFM